MHSHSLMQLITYGALGAINAAAVTVAVSAVETPVFAGMHSPPSVRFMQQSSEPWSWLPTWLSTTAAPHLTQALPTRRHLETRNVTCDVQCSVETVKEKLGERADLQMLELDFVRLTLKNAHRIECTNEQLEDCRIVAAGDDAFLRREMTTTHIIIIGVVVFVVLTTYMLASQLEFRRQHAYLEKLPHKRLPLGREDLSQKMHKIVVDETARCESDACSIAPPTPCAAAPAADPGWGIPRLAASEDGSAPTHFRTSIIKSFIVLEKAFAQRMQMQHQHQHFHAGAGDVRSSRRGGSGAGGGREGHGGAEWHRQPTQTVRDYMRYVRELLPEVPSKITSQYLEYYEQARFSEEHISLQAYNDFQALFLNLIVVIKRGG